VGEQPCSTCIEIRDIEVAEQQAMKELVRTMMVDVLSGWNDWLAFSACCSAPGCHVCCSCCVKQLELSRNIIDRSE